MKDKFNKLKTVGNENVAKKPDSSKVASQPAPLASQQVISKVQPPKARPPQEIKPMTPAIGVKPPSNPYLPADNKPKIANQDIGVARINKPVDPNNFPSRPPPSGQPYSYYSPSAQAQVNPQKPSPLPSAPHIQQIKANPTPPVAPSQQVRKEVFQQEKEIYMRHLDILKNNQNKPSEEDKKWKDKARDEADNRRREKAREEEERKKKRAKELEEDDKKKKKAKDGAEIEARILRIIEEEEREKDKEVKKQKRQEERQVMMNDIAKKRKDGVIGPQGSDVVINNYSSSPEENNQRRSSRAKAGNNSGLAVKKVEQHMFEERPSSKNKNVAPIQKEPNPHPQRIKAVPQVFQLKSSNNDSVTKTDITRSRSNGRRLSSRDDLSIISGITDKKNEEPTTLFDYTNTANNFLFDPAQSPKEDKITNYFQEIKAKKTGGFNDVDDDLLDLDDIIDINKASNEIQERMFGIGGGFLDNNYPASNQPKLLNQAITNVDFITV